MNPHASILRGARALLAIVLLSALLLTACATETDPPKPTFKGTLTLWAAPGLAGQPGAVKPEAAWFEERARAFEAANPDIMVELKLFDTPADLELAITSPGAAELPDLYFGRALPELAPRLADISAALTAGLKADFLPGVLAAYQRGDALHGIPVLAEIQVLALNEHAFAANDVSLPENGRWSLQQFEEQLKSLSGDELYGLGFSTLPAFHEWWPLADGLLTPNGEVAEGAEAGLVRLQQYRQNGWLHPDTAKVGAADIWALFAGKPAAVAIMPVSTWAIPLLRQEPYNVALTVAGFPDGLSVGYAHGFSIFQQADPAKAQAAAALALFMAAPDQQVRLARETGLMPARKSGGNPFEGDAQLTRAYELAADFRPLPAGPAWDQAEVKLTQELRLALVGGATAGEALAEVKKHIAPATAPAPQ